MHTHRLFLLQAAALQAEPGMQARRACRRPSLPGIAHQTLRRAQLQQGTSSHQVVHSPAPLPRSPHAPVAKHSARREDELQLRRVPALRQLLNKRGRQAGGRGLCRHVEQAQGGGELHLPGGGAPQVPLAQLRACGSADMGK